MNYLKVMLHPNMQIDKRKNWIGEYEPNGSLVFVRCDVGSCTSGLIAKPVSVTELTRTPVLDLIKEFEQDDCNFEDISGVVDIALRYTKTMPDSHVKCLLYVLAKHVQNCKANETACKVAG